ncbi:MULTISPECIES: methyltransferase domain-containing protein [unclassified Streptomyces]|uniref:methyltransferase domain-containing protein n=1 Tax=unclassified Streptomyces TaxID=2593676 RepID=UPI0007F4DA81|nr:MULTISPECIES: methyltransferase domain-containing protein [unclassified Streptomyces]MCM1971702.1 methyltransferase domain-containing protein [Streptomyces sp. G1]SBT93895.1 Methyltransferase domain-containing protein [Streptomyces sp. DI166]
MSDTITPSASDQALTERLTHARYPRSNAYDARWVVENQMGPNALWLLEWLAPALGLDALPPGARVLDLGCGRAMTSVFLAREYHAQVTAADLWIAADDNARRIAEAGFADRVLPVHTEAHDLPFAEASFDAIVSVDAYQYFGTNDLYLPTLTRLLKPGGRVGIVVPALREEIDGVEPPEHLKQWWEPDYWCFHSPGWWRRHWTRSGAVEVETADWLEDGWRDWLLWCEVVAEESPEEFHRTMARRVGEMVRADEGRALGFVRVVGRRL